MMATCNMEFFCAGCNRTTEALSWSFHENLIAYGACHSVIIYKPMVEKTAYEIQAVLNSHNGRVNCVQWIENEEKCELVSGSIDKSLIVWHKVEGKWQIKQTLTGHTGAIESLSTLSHKTKDGKEVTYIVSSSADSSVRVWKTDEKSEFSCVQVLSFGNGFALSIAISVLPNNTGIVLVAGCDDTSIRLYALNTDSKFEKVISLSGHEDWVRCLSFRKTESDSNKELLLASSSQDTFVRLWKITSAENQNTEKDETVTLETQAFQAYSKEFMVVLESVLIGHEGWVLGLSWNPLEGTSCLLSASMDRTIIVWEYDQENEIWMDKARFGEVGGNTLGYFGCAFSPCGQALISHGFQGAFQLWKKTGNEGRIMWEASNTISGHFGEVEDFDWSPDGQFAITASTDQTTRLFAPWNRDMFKSTWHEIARPQIHGYDMKCIAILNKYKYISGAQEKVARVFDAPKSFYNNFAHISNIAENDSEKLSELPLGATVPVLGLSNKAVFEADLESWTDQNKDESKSMKASSFANEDPVPFNPSIIKTPPVEDVLLQHTLWPEIQKLYGHGFELFCLATDPDGSTLATACKASKIEHANILIWNTTTWQRVDNLCNSHTLTVTQMSFSKSGKYLLSVSRDRTWALHRRDDNDKFKFSLVQKTEKKTSVHSRIIWSCDWCPGDQYFVTASRDKKVLVWGVDPETQCWCAQQNGLDVCEPVTAVNVHNKKTSDNRFIVCVGGETGNISIHTWLDDWKRVLNVDSTYLFKKILR